jgi:threonine/homoserine/homoserine lactone efflux protein
MESVMPYVLAIVPTVGVGVLFYFVIKSILEGDRRERLAQARWEAEHDRRATAAGTSSDGDSVTPTTDR